MRELELIDALEAVLRPAASASSRIVRWMGDDAAVVRAGGYAVTSVDMMVDGVHFRVGQLSMEEIGHRALGAALSDLAAMGPPPARHTSPSASHPAPRGRTRSSSLPELRRSLRGGG
jgi:thiamine-monophosphate kinase